MQCYSMVMVKVAVSEVQSGCVLFLSQNWLALKCILNNILNTCAMFLVAVLEKPLEKKAGRNYGPPGTKKLVYFIDDINMPEVDNYGTVQPHTLIRQHMDYKHWCVVLFIKDYPVLNIKRSMTCRQIDVWGLITVIDYTNLTKRCNHWKLPQFVAFKSNHYICFICWLLGTTE